MAQDFNLPDLGENITSGDIVRVMVNEGDTIEPNQPVIEIETDKAVLEVPCPFGGRVAKVHVKQGQKAKVGAPLISVETNGAAAAPAQQKKAPPAPESRPQQAAKEEVQRGGGTADAKTRPAQERKAADDSKTAKTAPGGRKPPSGSSAAAPSEGEALRAAPPAAPKSAAQRGAREEAVAAGPATRRLARELGVELADVARRFPDERITEEHVKAFVRDRGQPAGAGAEAGAPAGPELPDFSQWGEIERVAFSSLQRKTAEHLSISWRFAPHVTQFDAADVTSLEALRKRYRERGPAQNIKLTVTAFVLKAVAAALKQFPTFNASLDLEKEELVLKHYCHIGVAVDTEAGLIVPVIRDVDRKRVLDLAAELEEVAERTRRRKIKSEELHGGCFTVTNLGGIGGTGFTPIINHPEVAILGLARSKQELYLDGDEMHTRTMLPLCLSYDHRVVNGADGARFTRKLAELLEDPELLLLQ